MAEFKVMSLSEIQNRRVKIKGVRRTKTMRVIRLRDNVECTINIKHFDKAMYEEVTDGAKKAAMELSEIQQVKRQKAAEEAEALRQAELKTSPLSRVELATMTEEALYKTPEWEQIPERRRKKATTKEAVIDLIVAQRG